MRTAILASLGKHKDFGLLILRVGLGTFYILHGYPKMLGGPETWRDVGGAMQAVGIDAFPVFFGFMAAFAELVGGFLLVVGLFFRPACLLLLATMAVAAAMHLGRGDAFVTYSRPMEMAVVFLGLLFIGPGRHSVDGK